MQWLKVGVCRKCACCRRVCSAGATNNAIFAHIEMSKLGQCINPDHGCQIHDSCFPDKRFKWQSFTAYEPHFEELYNKKYNCDSTSLEQHLVVIITVNNNSNNDCNNTNTLSHQKTWFRFYAITTMLHSKLTKVCKNGSGDRH